MKLKFLGVAYVMDVPVRDLTEEEVAQYGGAAALIATGAYAEDRPVNKKDKQEGDNGRS